MLFFYFSFLFCFVLFCVTVRPLDVFLFVYSNYLEFVLFPCMGYNIIIIIITSAYTQYKIGVQYITSACVSSHALLLYGRV